MARTDPMTFSGLHQRLLTVCCGLPEQSSVSIRMSLAYSNRRSNLTGGESQKTSCMSRILEKSSVLRQAVFVADPALPGRTSIDTSHRSEMNSSSSVPNSGTVFDNDSGRFMNCKDHSPNGYKVKTSVRRW